MQQEESFVYYLPEGIPDKVTAPLLCAGVAVFSPIKKYVKTGIKTAIFGIGGWGHLAVQYLSKMGVEVAAITSTISKKDYLMSIGATKVVNFTSEKEIKDNEDAFDLIMNTNTGSGCSNKLLSMTARMGTIIQVGANFISDNLQIGNLIVIKGINIQGSYIGSPKEVQEMLEFSAKNKVFPLCEEFDFEDFPKALEHMETNKARYRAVVKVQDYSEKNGFFKK